MANKSLMEGVPTVGLTTTAAQTTGVSGTLYGIVAKTNGRKRNLTIQMVYSGAPGASEYNLMGSIDGTNFEQIGSDLTGTDTLVEFETNVTFLRLDQVSRANAVTATGYLFLA